MAKPIRVDPPKLRLFVEDLRRIAGECRTGGDVLLAQTTGALNYDGQYAPWVQAIAGEGDHRLRTFGSKLDFLADLLGRMASAFEMADSLDQGGMPSWAAEYRALIDGGLESSTFPWWLIRGQKPPWMSDSVWEHMLPEDRDAYLASLGGSWREFASSGDYSQGTDADTWSAFLGWLYVQGIIASPPPEDAWRSAAKAAGKTLEDYLSDVADIPKAQVEAWFAAAEGHGFSQESAIHEIAAMARAGETVEEHFGFSMEGEWTEEDKDAMVEGVLFMSHGFARITEQADTAAEIFRQVLGGTEFTLSETGETEIGCERVGTGFACDAGTEADMSKQLTVHELGHVFNANINNRLEVGDHPERADLKPYEMLNDPDNRIVDDDGRHVTGIHLPGGFDRTNLGYVLGPGNDPFPWQQHARDPGTDDGNSSGEDFADMLLNWAFNSFDYSDAANGAGLARYNWMEERMADWITYATEPYSEEWLVAP